MHLHSIITFVAISTQDNLTTFKENIENLCVKCKKINKIYAVIIEDWILYPCFRTQFVTCF